MSDPSGMKLATISILSLAFFIASCGGGGVNHSNIKDFKQRTIGSTFPTLPSIVEKDWQAQRILRSSRLPLTIGAKSGSNQFSQQNALRVFLGERGVHPIIQIVENPSDLDKGQGGFGLSGGTELNVRSYALRVGAHEICDVGLRTVETPSGTLHAMGVLPQVTSVHPFTDDAWQSRDAAVGLAINRLRASGVVDTNFLVTKSTKCLYAKKDKFSPAWQIIVRMGHVPYRLFVGPGEVFEGDILSFDVSGKVKAYSSNPKDGTLSDFDVNVSGDGFLTNEYFTTQSGDSSIPRQQSSSNIFTQSPNSIYFAEQSAFAHVNRHFDFARSNGYMWSGPKPLTVKTNVTFQFGNVNGANYTAFDGQSGPFIMIGRGDGNIFQNLMFDSDVVSHEFGHHIVFASLTTTSGESLVIHEGMADAITFMRSGDACLGESICPLKSDSSPSTCQVNGKCLRSGETTIKYEDTNYKNTFSPHLKGQVISGLFWDLYRSGKIPVTDLQKLVVGTTRFLPAKADMAAFVVALLDADFAFFGQRYQARLIAAAAERGLGVDNLGVIIGHIDGNAPPPDSPNMPTVSGASVSNTSTPTWNWTSGGGGNGTFRYRLDSGNLSSDATVTTNTSFTPSSALTDGKHVLYVQERNSAETWSPSGSKAIIVDTAAPTSFAITGPTNPINNQTPIVTWGTSSDSSGVTYVLEVASSRDCTTGVTQTYPAMSQVLSSTSQQLTYLAEGTWYACVKAIDAFGNTTKASNDGYQFTVDVTPPTSTVMSGLPMSPNSARSISLEVGGQSLAAYKYTILKSVDNTCKSGVTYGNWITASKRLSVDLGNIGNTFVTLCLIGRDLAGNVQSSPSIYRWLRIGSAPANTITAEFATIQKGARGAGTQIVNFIRNSNIKNAEKATALLCKYRPNTGELSGCLSRDAIFKSNAAATSVLFSPMSVGNWVGLLIPVSPASGRAIPLPISY